MLISPPYPEKISSFLTSDYVSKDIGAHNTHLWVSTYLYLGNSTDMTGQHRRPSRPSPLASTSSISVRAMANSPPSPSTGIFAEYRRLDNFEDYEAILRRVDEISEFLSEKSGSASA